MGGVFQPSTVAQYVLLYLTILCVSKDGILQIYGQKNAWTDAEKQFLNKIKLLKDKFYSQNIQVILLFCPESWQKLRLLHGKI